MCVDVTLILTRVKRHHDDKCTVATEHTGTTDNRPTVQNGVDASPLTVRCFVTPYFCSKNLLSVRARVTSDNIIIPGLFLAGDVADVLYAESNIHVACTKLQRRKFRHTKTNKFATSAAFPPL